MKNKILALTLFATICSTIAFSQNIYLTKNAKVSFFSKSPLENIEAVNSEVTSFLDISKGEFAFVSLIKSFKFKKALMEEHFNENYMESNKIPKANFKGAIEDISKVNFTKDGTYTVSVKGDLTVHGVTKSVITPATIKISGKTISASSKFSVRVKDYGIKVPAMYVNNIAEVVEVTVDAKFEPRK
ncbi:MAG: YceI family protein [Chitinophagaceae bacterium]